MTQPGTASGDSDQELARLYASLTGVATSGHPDEDVWVRFAAGDIDEEQGLALADHIVRCSECAATLRVLNEVRNGARSIDPGLASPDRFVSAPSAWLALAASVMLAAGGLWLWRSASEQSPPSRAAISAPTAPTPAAPPGASNSPAAPVVPQWASLGEPPIVRLPTDLLTMRGVATERDAFMTEFGRAIVPYREARFAEAIEGLQKVAADHPAIVEASFYAGAAMLFGNGNAVSAADAFARAANSQVVGDDARWLEAVALARGGRTTDATARLQTLCDGRSIYRTRACTALAQP